METTTAPVVTVERFDVDAEEQRAVGRPRVAAFSVPKRGRFDARVQRDDGSLWLWAIGPSGGDRGRVVFGLKRAALVLDFANAITASNDGGGPSLSGGEYALRVRRPWKDHAVDEETTDRLVSVTKGLSLKPFTLRFDAAALDELATLLREWATTTLVATREPPVIGEYFARGELPGGTAEQQLAWLRAGPETQLVRITGWSGDTPKGMVRYSHVRRDGSLGGILQVPLGEFYGAGWRRVG